jgi:16S rRNA (guanine527-N7)-methyltransferase
MVLWREQLLKGLAEMEISLSEEQQQKLLDYLALLLKWNRAYNLTAVRDPMEMVPRQLLDSLSILTFIQGQRLLDVGTGAGLPGIPLAIVRPEMAFTLLDSNGKKTRFVQQARMELGLENVDVVQGRVEDHRAEGYHTITCRAFATLPKIVGLTQHLAAAGALLVAMKGTVPEEEIRELEQGGISATIEPLQVPMTEGERHVILAQYPKG